MSPLHQLSFAFRLVVVTPRLVTGYYVIQQTVNFSLVLVQQVLTYLYSVVFLFLCKVPWCPPGTRFAISQVTQHRIQCTEVDLNEAPDTIPWS